MTYEKLFQKQWAELFIQGVVFTPEPTEEDWGKIDVWIDQFEGVCPRCEETFSTKSLWFFPEADDKVLCGKCFEVVGGL